LVARRQRGRIFRAPERRPQTIEHSARGRHRPITAIEIFPAHVRARGPQRLGMNDPARGSRRPHQGQKRMNAAEVGQRQRGQRSGNAGCDQTRLTLRLHIGQ